MKLSVLFVDDDANIIGGLRRMMYPMKKEWDLLYANGGKEAIETLEQTKVDVIISDIRMPGIDGTQLLSHVKENYPQIVRITLSGFANDNLAMRNTKIVHQSLSKPTTPESIKKTIEKAYKLRQKLNNEELLSIVNGVENLPSLPEIYIKLEEEINSPHSSIEKLSKIISQDPIITAKILQLTNSAFFGLANRISNISQALNYLGIKLIQNLVLSIKLFKSIDPKSPHAKLYEDIWNRSNKVACMSKKIASLKKLSKLDIEDSYLGGLLQDIGKLIILENMKDLEITEDMDFSKFEDQYKNTTHADIGAYLLGIWGLPDAIVEAVAFHDMEETILGINFTPTKVVSLANKIVNETNISADEISLDKLHEIIFEYETRLSEDKI